MVLALASVTILSSFAADEKEPKYNIKQVMKAAHKDGLMAKIAEGKGEKADAEKLVELYTALGQNKPPKGEAESWKAKTDAVLAAAKDVVAGKEGANAKLKATVNCGECHTAHKPS
jgi:hypothetical protein